MTPDVSIIFHAYNLRRYPRSWIERSIASVLEWQPDINVELCFGDDGSTDSTRGMIHKMINEDKRIKVGYWPRNTGGSDAANLAASMATGRYFLMLSARSWYERDSITKMVRYLDDNPDVGFVYGHNRYYNPDLEGQVIVRPRFHEEIFKSAFASGFGYLYRREAWDAGCRYGCTIWVEEAGKFMTIGDRHMVMQLIFTMGWKGYRMDTITLNYQRGIVPQMNDILKHHRYDMMQEYRKLWAHVGAV